MYVGIFTFFLGFHVPCSFETMALFILIIHFHDCVSEELYHLCLVFHNSRSYCKLGGIAVIFVG